MVDSGKGRRARASEARPPSCKQVGQVRGVDVAVAVKVGGAASARAQLLSSSARSAAPTLPSPSRSAAQSVSQRPCRTLSPIIAELASEYGDRVRVGKLDVDTNKTLASKHKVSSIPTVMLFANGEVSARCFGLRSKSDYDAAIDKLINKPST